MKDNLLKWVIGFSILKFIIHLYTNNLYELHRDEYLYIDEGKHMAWGFMEVPPFTPFLAWVGDLLGNHVWIYKMFPAIAGALIIYIIGKIIIELGGGKWAIIISSVTLLVSPALLRSSSLFQPVIFNQLGWLLCAYCIIKIIKEGNDKYYYLLGVTAGITFLNKYSILFYVAALVIGLMMTPQRSILFKRQTLYAIGIAAMISLPNIFWQWSHSWPVLAHMAELQETQLVHVEWGGFISEQFLFHLFAGLVWMAGVYAMFRYIAFYQYRSVVFALVATIIIIGSLSGKPYYAIGAFYILFPFGAIALETLFKPNWSKIAFVSTVVILSIPFLPLGTPLVPIDQFQKYNDQLYSITGMDDHLYWEDGEKYDLPQDYADMHGWKEMAANVAKHYHALPDSIRATTMIYGISYGHAGAINLYRDQYNLPEAYSANGSYMWWADANAQFDQVLLAADYRNAEPWRDFNTITLLDSTNLLYARDPGYIYLMTDPKRDPSVYWNERYVEMRKKFGR